MSLLFKRKYKLIVGIPTVTKSGPIPYKTQSTEGREFELTSHHIEFNIDKTNTPSNNSCSITIVNTSDAFVDYFEQNAGTSPFVKLEVAYGSQPLKELFLGTLTGMEDNFIGTTRRTTLKCSDGYANLKENKTSRSYRKKTTIQRIVEDMIKDLGLPKGTVIPIQGETKSAKAYSGAVREIITTIAKDNNYNFSIQDGRVNMTPFDYSSGPLVKVINVSSGMIGSPTALDTSSGQLKGNKDSKQGVSVKCLIDASVRPDSLIILESRKYNGTFKVNKVSYRGSYEGSDWAMDIECEPVGSS